MEKLLLKSDSWALTVGGEITSVQHAVCVFIAGKSHTQRTELSVGVWQQTICLALSLY